MILDKDTMFANDLAYNGSPSVVDLGSVKPARGGEFQIFVTGSSDLAGVTGITITDGATSAAADAFASHTATLAGKTIKFTVPSDIARYMKVALAGTPSAGSWSAGVVLPGVQTNT